MVSGNFHMTISKKDGVAPQIIDGVVRDSGALPVAVGGHFLI